MLIAGRGLLGLVLAGLVAAGVAAAVAGCGEADSSEPRVTLQLTRDFGREVLAEEELPLEGHETPLRLLREHHRPSIGKFGGLTAIDGLRQRVVFGSDQERAWVLNVNGIEADLNPRELPLFEGDVVQFDLRDIYVTLDVRATVGAFPQPFTGGMFGNRFPVDVRCARGYAAPCGRVRRVLRAAGVEPDGSRPAGAPTERERRTSKLLPLVERAVVFVGPWNAWADRRWPRLIDDGPHRSGVFARFTSDRRSLRLLHWDDRPVRTAAPGTGLVAAMRPTEADLLWFVTGVGRRGVERAVDAFDPDSLRFAFAVVVTADGPEKIPLPPPGS